MLGIQRWIKLLWSLPHCSVTKSCLTLHDPMDCSMPGFPVLHYLLEFAQTHMLWVGDAIQPSHLLSPRSPALNHSQHPGSFPVSWFFKSDGQNAGASASATVLPVNSQRWFPLGLTVWSPCCPTDSQESSPAPQFKSISSSALGFIVQLSRPYMTTGKNTALTRRTFVGKVMPLLFNMLSG